MPKQNFLLFFFNFPNSLQSNAMVSLSPSFNSDSNSDLGEVPDRIVEESRGENCVSAGLYDEFCFEKEEKSTVEGVYGGEIDEKNGGEEGEEDEDEFEFAFVKRDSEFSSQISADEIFHNGMIRPEYPIFNRNFLQVIPIYEGVKNETRMNSGSLKGTKVGLPLRKLFIEERETATTSSSSSASSEADELDGIPSESYCVWRPKEAAEGQWKKSSSTGSNSKKWKFKDFLHRSQSVGSKDNFVLLSPNKSGRKNMDDRIKDSPPGAAGKLIPPPYKRDAGEKRRSYLPYRQDLVGFFANANGLSKNFQPF